MLQRGEENSETLGKNIKWKKGFANSAKWLKHNQVKVRKGKKERCETTKNKVKIINAYKLERKKTGRGKQ